LTNVNRADDHSSLSRPLYSPLSRVNCPTVVPYPPEAACSGISLSDRVCCNEPKRPAKAEKSKRTTKEVRHKIRVAVGPLVKAFKPLAKFGTQDRRYSLSAHERRIP